VKRLAFTEIARADLAAIRRYSLRTWGPHQTSRYLDALRDTMKGLAQGSVVSRPRSDLRPAILMATSGRHSIFFESDESRILVIRVLHDSMDYQRHLGTDEGPA
jgi:toxin ParE1/3/4